MIPAPLPSPLRELSNDIPLVHLHLQFFPRSSVSSASAGVCMFVCVPVVVASIYCSSLDTIAPSDIQTHLQTLVVQRLAVVVVIILIVIVVVSMVVCTICMYMLLFSCITWTIEPVTVHAAPITLSSLDVLAAAIWINGPDTYENSTHILIYNTYIQEDDCTHSSTHPYLVFTMRVYVLRLVIFVCLLSLMLLSLSLLLDAVHVSFRAITSTLLSPLCFFYSSFYQADRARTYIDVYFSRLFAALNQSETMDSGKPCILCVHLYILPLVDSIATLFMEKRKEILIDWYRLDSFMNWDRL